MGSGRQVDGERRKVVRVHTTATVPGQTSLLAPSQHASDVTIPSGHPIMMSYAQQTHQRRGEEEEDEVEREEMEQSLM